LSVAALTLLAAPLAVSADPGTDLNRQSAFFGNAVALTGDQALVGEPQGGTGTVHVYRRVGQAWQLAGTLPTTGLPDRSGFGASVVADGATALVAMSADSGRGGVAVYTRAANGTWSAAGRLGGVMPARSQFGAGLAISGDWAFVGAPGVGGGEVHVFRRSGTTWTAAGTLPASELGTGDRFGSAISVDGDRVAVTATGRETNKGMVFVFRRGADGSWTQEAALTGRRLPANARLGTSVILMGDRLWAGAPQVNSFSGMVVGFARNAAGEWAETATLTPIEMGPARFGTALAAADGELWIGASASDFQQGRIFRARFDARGRVLGLTKLAIDGLETGAGFGSAIAVLGTHAAVGMPTDGGRQGTVAFLARSAQGEWVGQGTVFPKVESPFKAYTGAERICGEGGKVEEFECSNTGMLSFLPIDEVGGKRGTRLNDNWGWTDPQTGKEYAIVGRTDGTSFVDVSNPGAPRYLGDLPKTEGSPSAAWRDMKVYKDHVFIVADGSADHGMQVFDLTRLRTIRTPETFEPDYHYTGIASAHNIVSNVETGYMYIVGASGGGETCGGGLHMINVQEPKNPVFAGCFQDKETGRAGTGYSHDAQCVTYRGPDAKYQGREICVGSNENAISIADVTDKASPVAVSRQSYPDVAYAHQAWLTDDHRYLFLGDELDEGAGKGEAGKGTRTLIFDLADLDDPILIKEHVGTRRATDHNLYIKGNRMYQANYNAGLRILDISDPTNPREVGFLDTAPGDDTPQMDGAWSNYPYFKSGTIVVTSTGQGLFLVKDRTQVVP
jgi:choice-of-anchor B domain-containing protein